jgi:hypothetical protein
MHHHNIVPAREASKSARRSFGRVGERVGVRHGTGAPSPFRQSHAVQHISEIERFVGQERGPTPKRHGHLRDSDFLACPDFVDLTG